MRCVACVVCVAMRLFLQVVFSQMFFQPRIVIFEHNECYVVRKKKAADKQQKIEDGQGVDEFHGGYSRLVSLQPTIP